jgi:hypothetical protein
MLILWIRKKEKDEQTCPKKNEQDSLQKHIEEMKKFRLTHPKIEATNPKDIITADGNLLAAVQEVKLAKHVQN